MSPPDKFSFQEDMLDFRDELLRQPPDPPRRQSAGVEIISTTLEGLAPSQPESVEIEKQTYEALSNPYDQGQ